VAAAAAPQWRKPSGPGKPVFLAETGVAPGAQAAHQIESPFTGLDRYRLTGLVWFDINRLERWRLEGRVMTLS
jgi:hypothetical protein